MAAYDVAIVGGGFTGSLLAYVLASRGVRVAIIDARPHPRFAIGESSTPVADLLLEKIARQFSLEPLLPLCRYGTWKQHRPELVCGKKRGFSYFVHHPDTTFQETQAHERSLLVAASADDQRADVHWLRADVDHYFFRLAADSGAEPILGMVTELSSDANRWTLRINDSASPRSQLLACNFIVDASGGDRRLQLALGVQDASDRLLTDTATTYGHFVGVGSWSEWLRQHDVFTDDHPFDCDHAAQHHLLRDGWLWMLRMDDGRTSVGWTRPRRDSATAETRPSVPHPLAALGIDRYPSLCQTMRAARLVAPETGLRQAARIQRLASRVVGANFALMPTAAATVDPLHSSGIAHGLSGVQRLARILLASPSAEQRLQQLARYEQQVYQEVLLLDRLVAGCYLAMPYFELFTAHLMCYFVAAIRCEEAIAAGEEGLPLWCAGQPELVRVVDTSLNRLHQLIDRQPPSSREIERHVAWTLAALAPWNTSGLLDASANNMYRYTAAPK